MEGPKLLICMIIAFPMIGINFSSVQALLKGNHVLGCCPFDDRASSVIMPMEPIPTTTNGCQCISDCKASWHDLYKQDWCITADQCGEYREDEKYYWDYCSFQESDSPWESLDWKTKHNALWAAVKENSTMGPFQDYHVSDYL